MVENKNYKSYHVILENIVNKECNKCVNKEVIYFFEFLQIKSLEELKEKFEGKEGYENMVKKVENIYTDPKYIGYYYTEDKHRMELEHEKQYGIEIGEKRGIEIGEGRGLKVGIDAGRDAAKSEIAEKLLAKGMPEAEVFEIIGMPINKKLKKVKNRNMCVIER